MEYKAKDEYSDAIKEARAKVGAYNENSCIKVKMLLE